MSRNFFAGHMKENSIRSFRIIFFSWYVKAWHVPDLLFLRLVLALKTAFIKIKPHNWQMSLKCLEVPTAYVGTYVGTFNLCTYFRCTKNCKSWGIYGRSGWISVVGHIFSFSFFVCLCCCRQSVSSFASKLLP